MHPSSSVAPRHALTSSRARPFLAALGLALALATPDARAQARGDARLDADEIAMLAQINAYRAERGAGPVAASGLLGAIAHAHATDMATRGYFEHRSLEGRTPFDRMRAAGYDGDALGENLAAGHANVARTFTQWRNSPPHDAAMLDGEYRAAGVARVCVPGSPFECYWALELGDWIDPSAFALPQELSAGAPAPVVRAVPALLEHTRAPASRDARRSRRARAAAAAPRRGRVIVVDAPVASD